MWAEGKKRVGVCFEQIICQQTQEKMKGLWGFPFVILNKEREGRCEEIVVSSKALLMLSPS